MRNGTSDKPVSEGEAAQLFGALDSLPALILAVSGGPDSTALMWLAARWRDELEKSPRLVAVTIDPERCYFISGAPDATQRAA